MNKVFIIGNLTRDPETRTTSSGITVCSFTLAVNRRKKVEGQPDADFFRVSAWRVLGENCQKYLAKGRKAAVVGSIAVQTYKGSDGTTRASMEVNADDVEFLTPRGEQAHDSAPTAPEEPKDDKTGYAVVDDDLPF